MGISDLFVDPDSLPDNAYGKIQLIFLLLVYGFILSKSSQLISDGSELLLLIPALAGIVGSIVLPVLGAVPDGAIVLFSGMGTPEEVKAQISVGVGALAGSTIMLMTIPWALCIITGRVDIVNGIANYRGKPKLTPENNWSWRGSGVTPRKSIGFNAKIMIATSISYIIIQASAFAARCDTGADPNCKPEAEHWWALVALLATVLFFIGYMVYNIKTADSEDKEDFIAEVRKQAVESHIISLSTAFEADLNIHHDLHLLSKDEKKKRFEDTLMRFFKKYDTNGDGVIDVHELRFLLKDIGENMQEDRFQSFLREIDLDGSGNISFNEFAVAMKTFILKKSDLIGSEELSVLNLQHHSTADDDEEDEEEEEEIPEDLATLPPNQQKRRILLRAAWMMGLGTFIVLLFSDPMVSVLNTLGTRFNIKPFYIAFVLAPVASNASELIASIAYALKKTRKTITISLAALEGAACMNNTFCLGIFLALIFFKRIAWEFSAETISIFFVEAAIFGLAQVRTHRLYFSIIVFALYPISIFLVWFLENVAGLN